MTTFMRGHAVRWDIWDDSGEEAWDVDVLAAFGELEEERGRLEQRCRDRRYGFVAVEPVDDGSGNTRLMLVVHHNDLPHDHPHRISAESLDDARSGARLMSLLNVLAGREQ